MNIHLKHVRAFLDIAFLAGVVFALLVAERIVTPLILVGVVPIPFLLKELRGRPLAVPLWRLVAPAAAYFGYSIIVLYFFPGLTPGERKPINPGLELYLVAIAMLAVGLLRGLEVRNLQHVFHFVVPWALCASFIVLTALMFLGYRSDCRVFAGASWPFIPAIVFSTLSFLTYLGWRDHSARERNFRLLLNALSIVVVTSFTGSRGIGIAQFGVLSIFLVLGLLPRFAGALPSWRQIAVSTLGGIALCGAVALATGCGPLDRLVSVFKTAIILSESKPASPPTAAVTDENAPVTVAGEQAPDVRAKEIMNTDVSIGVRLEMWKTSIDSIRESPFLGHGALYMKRLIAARYGDSFEHNHNQYLSWLVTGGALALTLGIFLMATPWLVSFGLGTADRLIVALSISVFWALAVTFDSYFNLKFYLHYYCLLSGLLYALVNDMLSGGRQGD